MTEDNKPKPPANNDSNDHADDIVTPKNSSSKPTQTGGNKADVSKNRKIVSNIIALIVAVGFVVTVLIIVEARQNSFYGEPLFEKMQQVIDIKLNGLPTTPEARARTITGIPNLLLLPPEAVLPKAPAERFKRIGTQFGYLLDDAKLGTKYECKKSDIDRIPIITFNIAVGLDHLPEDLLKRVQLEYIVFCGQLLTEFGNVAGFPAPPNNTMFLNLARRTSDKEIKALFFHEFYHLFEDRYGLVKDMEWMKHFDKGYYHTYEGFMRPQNNEMGTGGYGFMNRYSRTHPYEDRAEIFSALMVSRREFIYYILRNNDEMLAAKTQYIAQTAKEHLGIDFGNLWQLN